MKEIDALDLELRNILDRAVTDIELECEIRENANSLSGVAFESTVCESLNRVSLGSSFQGKFEQSSSLSFPDIYSRIVENQWFGIEVKTSRNDWRCFGNSIFESTRVENLEDRIYVFFGRLNDPVSCRWARYDECIDNINITHSPRYQINMEVRDGNGLSIFSRMNISYLDFHQKPIKERMEFVRNLKRKELGSDVALWWLPENEEPTRLDEERLLIKMLSSLSVEERNKIRNLALAFFPETYGKKISYERILRWLASDYGVVTGNMRDFFTAGGKRKVVFQGKQYLLPRVYSHLANGIFDIRNIIIDSSPLLLERFWGVSNPPENSNERLNLWINLVMKNSSLKEFPLEGWLRSNIFFENMNEFI